MKAKILGLILIGVLLASMMIAEIALSVDYGFCNRIDTDRNQIPAVRVSGITV